MITMRDRARGREHLNWGLTEREGQCWSQRPDQSYLKICLKVYLLSDVIKILERWLLCSLRICIAVKIEFHENFLCATKFVCTYIYIVFYL